MLTNKICARQLLSSSYLQRPLSIPICRPWTSLGNTVFTQIVSSYNYERLIRSISTPFCLPNMYTFTRTYICTPLFVLLFLRPSIYTPLLFIPSIRTPSFFPSISALFTYTLYSYLYSYASILTPSLPIPYYSPLYMYT